MDQKQIMRDGITDKELTLVCSLVTTISDYHRLPKTSQPTQMQLRLGVLRKIMGGKSVDEPPPSLHDLNQTTGYDAGWKIVTASHWERIDSSKSNDYMGIILVNESKKLLLLAHRGMQTGSIPNIANCLNIALDRYVPISQDAIKMCNIAVNLISTQYKEFTLCHTGFSMGGFLAQITASHCNNAGNTRHNQAICYDPPGAGHAINTLKYNDNRSNIIIYLTSPNVVNTGKSHYGYVRQILQWENENNYENKYCQYAVEKSFNIEINDATTGLNYTFLNDAANSHLYLFNPTYSPFNEKNNFDFKNVEAWPIAENKFNPKTTSMKNEKMTAPNIDSSASTGEAFLQFVKNMGNAYIEAQVDTIAFNAGVSEIESITHQVMNPKIKYSAAPFLHGNVVPVTSVVESTIPIYSSLLTKPTFNEKDEKTEESKKFFNHPPSPQ